MKFLYFFPLPATTTAGSKWYIQAYTPSIIISRLPQESALSRQEDKHPETFFLLMRFTFE